MAINKPTLTQYADNFSIDIFKTNDTLNLFSDASMRTVSKKDHVLASCYGSVANFMSDIQSYLPKSLQSNRPAQKLWSHYSFQVNDTQIIAEKTKELLDQMVEWLIMMRQKIEDYITARYYRDGRINHLEILKRRYKDEWAERVEQSVDANVNQDMSININFEDYE